MLATGFLGSRLDHSFAALASLGSAFGGRLVLMAGEDLVFAVRTAWQAKLPEGTRVSILALRPVRVTSAAGLQWSPVGKDLHQHPCLGISNRATDELVHIRFDGAGGLVVVERSAIQAVLDSLR